MTYGEREVDEARKGSIQGDYEIALRAQAGDGISWPLRERSGRGEGNDCRASPTLSYEGRVKDNILSFCCRIKECFDVT